jgi:hypothetical protein
LVQLSTPNRDFPLNRQPLKLIMHRSALPPGGKADEHWPPPEKALPKKETPAFSGRRSNRRV